MEQYLMYLRKSQMDRDFEDVSVEETLKRHKKILTDFAKQKRLNVVHTLEEVVSGESLSERPQMMKCLELINTGKFEGIVCMDIDRLSRGSSLDSGYIMQVLQINNCKIVTPSKIYDLANESDEQFTDMKFMFSRYELKTITKRLIRGRNQSASEGKFLGSIPPFGYEIIKLKGEKGNTLQIVPEQAKVVQMIYDMYTEQNMGVETIVYELNKMHIPTQKQGGKWAKTSVLGILRNPVYIGKIKWKGFVTTKVIVDGKLTKKRVRNDDFELHDGLHEPIITEEQFKKVTELRSQKYHVPTNLNKEIMNPFAGLMFCKACGKPIQRYHRPDNSNVKPRFRCGTIGCDCKSVRLEDLESAIVSEMKKWLEGYMITIEQTDNLNVNDDLSVALQMVESQLSEAQNQQNKICELLEKGIYSIEVFSKRNAVLTADIERLTADKDDLMQQIENQNKKQANVKSLLPITQQLLDSYNDLNPKEKNELWKQVLEKIIYYREVKKGDFELQIYPKIPSLNMS